MTDDGLPRASVVIASNRGPERVRACLEALAAQEYPRDGLEVVVVDDGGPEPLTSLVAELEGRLCVLVHAQENAGPAVARNAGARLASGELLAFTDDDCLPTRDWLRRLADAVGEHPDALVGGTVRNVLPDDRYAEATQSLVTSLAEAYREGSERRFFTSNNLAVRRDAFVACGGFDEEFPVPGGEDRELCERWRAEGRPLVLAPDAVVLHAHAMTFRSFLRQHRNYGRGAYALQRRRGRDGRRAGREGASFYLRLVTDPFRRRPLRQAVPEAALLAVTQVATAAGYLEERRRERG